MHPPARHWFVATVLITAALANAEEPHASLTFYREKDKGNTWLKNESRMFGKNPDFVGSYGYSWDLFVDGKRLATLKLGRFVTVELPPGSHRIQTSRSAPIKINLHAGDHIYVRPGLHDTWTGLRRVQTLTMTSCAEAAANAASQPLIPVANKDLHGPQVVHEIIFPAVCNIHEKEDLLR